MGSTYKRGRQWTIGWKDLAGQWREKRTKCSTKAEAENLVRDIEINIERQSLGLAPLGGVRGTV